MTSEPHPMRMSFSVIIEWENAKLSELARARRMLEALAAQTRDLDRSHSIARDLIFLYDPDAIDPQVIQSVRSAAMGTEPLFQEIKILPVRGKRYYELKNYGATQTDADVIVFLDSDVIPEEGWLEHLLEAIQVENVDIVGGNTYVTLESLYSKAFAIFWFFPLRSERDELRVSQHFFANNVAFRKSVFDAYPFPDHEKFRGQCVDLARQLNTRGYDIYLHEGARVHHPPPNGVRHFVARALCAGSDEVCMVRSTGARPSIHAAWIRFRQRMSDAKLKVKKQGAQVGLGAPERGIAHAIAFSYYGIAFAGECITLMAPRFIARYFPI